MGWRGACSNTSGDCVVTMTAARQVSAVFSAGYTQPTLTAMSTTVAANDVMELRTAVNTLRAQNFGLAPFLFADDPLQAKVTNVQARHVTDLRAALNDAYVQAGVGLPSYVEAITAGVTTIKASHLRELRNGVRELD